MAQTAFRFSDDLIRRLKNRARLDGKSVNQFVEEVIERELSCTQRSREDIAHIFRGISTPESISDSILALPTISLSGAELDERDKYILGK